MSTETLEKAKSTLPVKGFLDLKDIDIPQGEDLVKAILQLFHGSKEYGWGQPSTRNDHVLSGSL